MTEPELSSIKGVTKIYSFLLEWLLEDLYKEFGHEMLLTFRYHLQGEYEEKGHLGIAWGLWTTTTDLLSNIEVKWSEFGNWYPLTKPTKETPQAQAQSVITTSVLGFLIIIGASVAFGVVSRSLGLEPGSIKGNSLVNFIFALAGLINVAILIFGAYQYMTSAAPSKNQN